MVAVLSGALDITCAPDLRERFLRLSFAPPPAGSSSTCHWSATPDASGLAVWSAPHAVPGCSAGRCAWPHPRPAMTKALRAAGLDMQLDIFPTVQSAIRSPAPA